ncbi:hypothetical protein EJ06DRAFT_325772 [Trichodelitschia bisporula]|uniref:Uncharacterized protein n=1 Tax=Trichodelitschia bisporula TaxID=703511 RepID=A0A6G1I5E8_9PEZI|nr:hypothetical protein EJ06DRAFT_325772 [Trichodelitschia bisporula]
MRSFPLLLGPACCAAAVGIAKFKHPFAGFSAYDFLLPRGCETPTLRNGTEMCGVFFGRYITFDMTPSRVLPQFHEQIGKVYAFKDCEHVLGYGYLEDEDYGGRIAEIPIELAAGEREYLILEVKSFPPNFGYGEDMTTSFMGKEFGEKHCRHFYCMGPLEEKFEGWVTQGWCTQCNFECDPSAEYGADNEGRKIAEEG